MRVLVYFQPKEKFDNFEGTRLRKSIKGALEIEGIEHTSNEFDKFDVAHFISPNDEQKIDECIRNNIPVVISVLYCEADPKASILEYKNKKDNKEASLSPQAFRVLNKVDRIFVPTGAAKQFLIDAGITKQIEVVTPGINISRFNYLKEVEKEVFYRYYREDESKTLVVSVGTYESASGIRSFINTAKRNSNCIFYYFAQYTRNIPKKFKELIKTSPKNCHFVTVPSDDIYRSALVNSKVFMFNGYRGLGIISILEAMAAHTEIIARETPLYSDILIGEKTCHVGQFSETLTAIANDYLDGKIAPTNEEAFKYATTQGLDVLGERLKGIYQKLLLRR